ncbi:MAG: transcription elongation factor Spt5 [Candidatus Hadarchaeales archaeon]
MEDQRIRIFAVRTTIGQEKNSVDMMISRAKDSGIPVKLAMAVPGEIKGYVFVEAADKVSVEQARAGVKHARGVVAGEVPLSELEQFLAPRPSITGMEVGDVVELISGPFRGERARIIRVDEGKEELTVELFEATVPIPVTVRGDAVKVIQKKEG